MDLGMTEQLTPAWLAAIDLRREAATPGPWSVGKGGLPWDLPVYCPEGEPLAACPDCGVRGGFDYADAVFVAHAPQDIADLRAEVERWRAKVARVEALADAMEAEAPRPKLGGFFADQIRALLADPEEGRDVKQQMLDKLALASGDAVQHRHEGVRFAGIDVVVCDTCGEEL